MEKSYRIHTNISRDTFINVNIKQDFDFLEVLSLKLRQRDAYRLHSSNYGVIIGRVLANDAFGIPNAKISVFIERDENDPVDMENVYPYSEVTSKDKEGRRYNLLPDYSDDDCYRVVGTFPHKRYLLDDDIQLEVYEKYWKYTTVTNNAGDYMIFGVPAGSQRVHVDIDLSDIGVLSQKPRDFTYRGYDLSEFDSPSQFKSSTNFDSLRQIFSQDKSVYVYPFWGDDENGIAAITRCDIEIAYKFEPTCVFMGSIISDNEGNSIGHKCAPSVDSGMNNQLIAGEGTIEMIRKTTDGLVEEYPIQGNALIDSDGVWCYQIPMNLDYVGTDEYGNIVPTDNPSKGIPTRTQVRFRISKTETGDEGFSRHTAKYLVPMNPVTYEQNENAEILTTQEESGVEIEKMYNFGSSTPQSCFRDLYWNNVYSVKNFIPKVQVAHRPYSANYSALKGSNLVEDQNPVPFNKLRIDIPFMYMIVCILFTIVMIIIHFINTLIWIIQKLRGLCIGFKIIKRIEICPFKLIIPKFGCIAMPAGLSEGNVAYYPGCHCPDSDACKNASCPEEMEGSCIKSSDNSELKDKIQQNLAKDYKIIKLDFYQDWLNGSLYMPLWYWRKRKKKKFLFLFTVSSAKNEFCDCDKRYSRLKTYVTCNMAYRTNALGTDSSTIDLNEDRWHKRRAKRLWFSNGIIKGVENKDGLVAYYYTAYQPNSDDRIDIDILQRKRRFLYVRLYATDIILLGNLNENNIYGIPQLYTALPSTTANIPPIAAIEESLADETNDSTPKNDTAGDAEDSGTTVTTGMDWGHDGKDQVPRYRKGLFMDLACTYAATRSKSCINVERLSELGVNPDMTFKMSFSNNGNDIKTGAIDADGFVSKYELDDMDNRAAFATLNHIGFIPQDYQDKISGYTTQVQDENTGYLVPKFKYIYPVDFDGRLELIMKNYKRGFEQATYDEADPSYVTFRLGAESSRRYKENSEERIRHFYFKDNNRYEMPVYNNSFYFYFGINKGSTAIDKFNKMFYAPCFQNVKKPFTLDYSFVGRSYCPSVYNNYKNYSGYGYIRVTLDDIQIPYSYKLYDSTGALVIEESDMEIRDFVIAGTIDDEGNVVSNENGVIKYQTGEKKPIDGVGVKQVNYLTNQQYTLYVTDVNGKTLSERIKLEMPKIGVAYESERLGTKFYNTGTTRIDYICNDETDFYGRLRILNYTVDGYMYTITACTIIGYIDNQYVIRIDGLNHDDEEVSPLSTSAFIKLGILDVSNGKITKDCLCDVTNNPTALQRATYSIRNTAREYWIRIEDELDEEGNPTGGKLPTFLVYQPNRFTVTIAQICDGKELEDNTTSEIVNVNNGENFNAFAGSAGDVSTDMPVKFMLGSVNDNNNAIIGVTSNFYRLDVETKAYSPGLKGWYGTHQEDTYQFHRTENQVLLKNVDTWTDFVTLNEEINTHASKATILAYKFNTMFSLSSAAYVVTDAATVYYSTRGGVHPTLYRSVVPMYSDSEKFTKQYVLNDSNMSTVISEYPMIVGKNYFGMDDKLYGPHWNTYYANREYLGNYFAAFTKNGGYISKIKIDPNIQVMKIPNYTKVTPVSNNTVKQIGKDIKGEISYFSPVYSRYNSFNPYLRTLFVDRRFDYSFVLFAPSMTNSIQLYPNDKTEDELPLELKEWKKEKIWKSARISGETFNGIELSYDEEYNIISADTDATDEQEATVAVPNKRLEYSYNFSDNDVDAVTVYNHEPAENVVWEGEGTKDNQIVKRFYEATYSGYDIRNFFWSDFNKQRLYDLIRDDDENRKPYKPFDETNFHDPKKDMVLYGDLRLDVPYLFKYPYFETELYNGDFNREEASKNYPTHRFIDMCNIPPAEVHDFSILPCSYEMNAYKDTDGTVKCEANSTDGVSFYDTYKPPINFIEPNAGNNDYGNVRYVPKPGQPEADFVKFVATGTSLCFKLTEKSVDGFKVYTAVPRVIKVLNYQDSEKYGKLDGISYIKTIAKNDADKISTNVNNDLFKVMDDKGTVCLHKFGSTVNVLWIKINRDIIMPNGVNIDHDNDNNRLMRHDGTYDYDYFFYKEDGGEFDERNLPYLTSDSNDFLNIIFATDIELTDENDKEKNDVKIFTIFLHREYIWEEDDKLKRRLTVIEHGDLYDVRHLLIRINMDKKEDKKPPMTYVEKLKLSPGKINAEAYNLTGKTQTPVPTSGGTTETGGTLTNGGGPVSGDSQTYVYIQVITFDFQFHPKYAPIDRECETFADYDMMRYIFRFKNARGDIYDIDKVEVTTTPSAITSSTTEVTLHFKIRWTQDMGILADIEWQDYTQVTIFAKTQENFTYKINEFKLDFRCQDGGYEPTTKKDSSMVISEGENINPNYTWVLIPGQSEPTDLPCPKNNT